MIVRYSTAYTRRIPMVSMIPIAKALYLCDEVLSDPTRSKPHLIGVLNAIRPPAFPHILKQLCVCAQLSGGHREVRCGVRIVNALDLGVVYESDQFMLRFDERVQIRFLILKLTEITIHAPGEYWIELTCNGEFMDDAVIRDPNPWVRLRDVGSRTQATSESRFTLDRRRGSDRSRVAPRSTRNEGPFTSTRSGASTGL